MGIKGVGQIICGTIEQGTLRPGDVIGIVPSGLKGKKMFSIEQHKKVLESAGPGNSVGMSIKVGYCPIIFSRTAKVACKMTKILWKQSKKTGNAKVEMPPELTQFENAEVEFEPPAPLFLEPFAKCAALGRIAVMDSNRLKMLGKVTGVTNAE